MRRHNDDDDIAGVPGSPRSQQQLQMEPSAAAFARPGAWDGSGQVRDENDFVDGSPNHLTAKADLAGFSPIRMNKSRPHSLDVDPRTKLPIVSVPADRRAAFADLRDVVLHVFMDCFKVTSGDQYVDRVLIVTDQTLFLCTRDGSCSRCLQVDRIKTLSVNGDKRALAIQIPSEYDILVRFLQPPDRDRVISVLRAVYFRMTHQRLEVETVRVRKFDPATFRIKKPAHYRLTFIPQQTIEQLRQTLLAFERADEEMLNELDVVQEEMQTRHLADIQDMQSQLREKIERYQKVVNEVWESDTKLSKLRDDVSRSRRLIEEVDGQFGPDGELPHSKDAQIAELEHQVARLNASVYVSGGEQLRRQMDENLASNYFQRDQQHQLFQPTWPGMPAPKSVGDASSAQGGPHPDESFDSGTGGGGGGELQSLTRMLSERLLVQQADLDTLQSQLADEAATEKALKDVKRRAALIRHLQRGEDIREAMRLEDLREAVDEKAAAAGGGAGGGASSTMGGGRSANTAAGAGGRGGAGGAGGRLERAVDAQIKWLRDLPPEINEETLHYDPRTSLRFVDIPSALALQFGMLQGCVIHFLCVVRKHAKNFSSSSMVGGGGEGGGGDSDAEKRVLFISDTGLFLAMLSGSVKRYIKIVTLDKIFIEPGSARIGFKPTDNFGLIVTCVSHEHRDEIINVLQRIFSYHSEGRSIPVTEMLPHQRLEAHLKLQAPPDYEVPTPELTSRRELINRIRERRDMYLHEAPATVSAASRDKPADVKISTEEWHKIRKRVAWKMDTAWRQDEELVALYRRFDDLRRDFDTNNRLVLQLQRKFESHRCEDGVALSSGASVGVPIQSSGTYRPGANGLFFISVDPVQINCELDVLDLTVASDFLFTGHANGHINIWDLHLPEGQPALTSNQALVRVLREHTGRITDMAATPARLYSSSVDGTVRTWDLRNGRCTAVMTCEDPARASRSVFAVNTIDVTSAQLMTGGADMKLYLWDLDHGRVIYGMEHHTSPILALRRMGDAVVTLDWGNVHVWDVRTGGVVRSVKDRFGGLSCLDFNGNVVVAGSACGDLTVWDIRQGYGETISGHADDVLQIQMAGRNAVTASGDFTIKMWDIDQKKYLSTFNDSKPFETKCFEMYDRLFVAGQGQFVKIWKK